MENINGKPWFKRLCYLNYDLKMKLTFTILLVSFLHLQATTTTYAQNTKLTIQMEGAKIAQIIETVESKSEFRFLFDRDDVDLERRVDIDVRAKKIGHILKVMFKGSDVAYNIENRQIVLNKSKQIKRTQVPSIEDTVVQQEYRVTGTVADQDGGPLPGANVVVVGTTTGVQTDFDGNFEITVPDGGVLEISYVGFTPQRFTITEEQDLQVQLQEDLAALEEVVVVGYGTQKKVNLTGAVSSVDFEELGDTRPITNISQGLAGQAPGVFVSQGSGKPGDDAASIRIRGVGTLNNSSPLVVIDGIVGNLSDVIPENIANISILKDAASAAIYGSRAANGVVLVTTKTGTSGKMTLAYNGYTGFQTPTLSPDMIWDYPTHMELINQAQLNVGKPEIFSQATIDDYRAGTDPIQHDNHQS